MTLIAFRGEHLAKMQEKGLTVKECGMAPWRRCLFRDDAEHYRERPDVICGSCQGMFC